MQDTTSVHNLEHAGAISVALDAVVRAQSVWFDAQRAVEIAGASDQNYEHLLARARIARHTFDTAANHLASVQRLTSDQVAPAPVAVPQTPAPTPAQSANGNARNARNGAGDRQQSRNRNGASGRPQGNRTGNRNRNRNAGAGECGNPDCGNPVKGSYEFCYPCFQFPNRIPGTCANDDCGNDANPDFALCWHCHNADADAA